MQKTAYELRISDWISDVCSSDLNMLSPQATIEPAELETGLKRLVIEALFSNTTAALTTGVVLTAFALHLGANNATIGLLAAIPFLTQLAQIPAIALVERLRERKRIAVLSSAFGRTILGVRALAPFAGALGLPIMEIGRASCGEGVFRCV